MGGTTRSRPVAVLTCVAGLVAATMVGGAVPAAAAVPLDPPDPGYETYPIPDRPALPGVGNTYLDPTFGTEIMQVTGPASTHAYSYWPTFNLDSTWLYIFRENDDVPAFYRFDPVNFELLERTPEPRFERICKAEDAMWSGVNPDVIHCHDGFGTLYEYDVPANTLTPIKDLGIPAEFQMTRSVDDQVFGWRLKNDPDGDFVGWVTWDRTTDTVQTRVDDNVDEIKLDKTGRYLVEGKILILPPGPDGIQNTVVDRVTGQRTDIPNLGGMGHGDFGTETAFTHEDWENQLVTRHFATPLDYSVALQWPNFDQDYHGSAIADDERWFLVSAYGTHTGPLASEVFQVQVDGCDDGVPSGCGTVRHIAHTFSSEDLTYYQTPRVAISRDGRFATYVTDWGTGVSGTNYVMVAKIG
jgi:hypothetical protein